MVGEGREKFGHVFLADTGTSNGDITGQTRPINTVDFKVTLDNGIINKTEKESRVNYR